MAARSGYLALAPEAIQPSAPGGERLLVGHATFVPAPIPTEFEFEDCMDDKGSCWSSGRGAARWKAVSGRSIELVKDNTGLLLVAASQFFFSLMNVAVKKLNSLDKPVPTLEVRHLRLVSV